MENQQIASAILRIFSDYNKQLGAYKIFYLLQRDYGIDISVGRVYRLMKKVQLLKMSTDKPKRHFPRKSLHGNCPGTQMLIS